MADDGKIFITGTGRSGTTFLIKIFSFLGKFNTSYDKDNYVRFISKPCNSGMERRYTDSFGVIKNPNIIQDIQKIVEDPNIKIKTIIIPIRDYKMSAKSRATYKGQNGGLWNAKDEQSQLVFYNEIIANYIYYMTKYEIPTIFLDFDKMVNDKLYLFTKLQSVMDEKQIDFDTFSVAYEEASLSSKPS